MSDTEQKKQTADRDKFSWDYTTAAEAENLKNMGIRPANLFKRVLAFLVDTIILNGIGPLAISLLLFVAFEDKSSFWNIFSGTFAFWILFSWIFGWIYNSVMHSSKRQATVGKMLLGLKVVNDEGDRITYGKALARAVVKDIPLVNLWGFYYVVTFVVAASSKERKAFHDYAAGTYVVVAKDLAS